MADMNDADGVCKRIYRTDRRRDKMIRNIIFDIGNVLTDYRWEGFLADKGFDAEMIQKIAKASVMHPAGAEYDRGTWTDEQVLDAFVKDAPQLEQELYQAFTSIAGIVTPRGYAIPWLQELKAKGFLTIAGRVNRQYFNERFYGTERKDADASL